MGRLRDAQGTMRPTQDWKEWEFTICQEQEEIERPWHHIWDLPVFHNHRVMVIYPYPFFVVITQFLACIIFINDCKHILTGSPGFL